ncbi:hypothetical protein LK09_11285 [Microbacterium mangrovi]|uniref:Pyridoxamine 5-phosphate oxidase n=1 Tax=Microbacterium mangrovi TaxID=1348253 RepID=A0A0B2A740_9MICO|nr:DUF1697 domain-containing protein [Microbacterium mangrovi]KHK97367.1 hypothetical protein LK09_11285 [Microbacterium mangrovi]
MATNDQVWVALLRGVNVGGITIRSADLAALFTDLGFGEVKTFLASGNVRFRASGVRTGLKKRIEAALQDRFGYDAWIVLVTREELADAVASFPFDAADASRQPYVVFCADASARTAVLEAAAHTDPPLDPEEDPVAPGPGVVYWSPAKGRTLDTPFAKAMARSSAPFRTSTTTRNLRTLQKILA